MVTLSSTISSVLIIISTIVIVLTIGVASQGEHFLWLQKSVQQSDVSQSHAIPFNNFLTSLWASYRGNYYDSHDENNYYSWGDGDIDWDTARALELNGWIKWGENEHPYEYTVWENSEEKDAYMVSSWAGGHRTETAYDFYLRRGVSDYSTGNTIKWGADSISSDSEVCRIYSTHGTYSGEVLYHRLNTTPIAISPDVGDLLSWVRSDDKYMDILIIAWNNYTYSDLNYNDLLIKNSGADVVLPLSNPDTGEATKTVSVYANTGGSNGVWFSWTVPIPSDIVDAKSLTIKISAYDVDYSSGERDPVYINGVFIGYLRGSDGRWYTTTFTIDEAKTEQILNKDPTKLKFDVRADYGWYVRVGTVSSTFTYSKPTLISELMVGGEDIKDDWDVYINGSRYSSPTDTKDIKRYHVFSNFFDFSQSGGKDYKYSILDIYPSAYWHKVIGDCAIMSWLAWWEYFANDDGSGDKFAVDSYIDNNDGLHSNTITISDDGDSSTPYSTSNEAVRKMVSNALAKELIKRMKNIVEDDDSNINMDINKLITWNGECSVAVHIYNVTINNDNIKLLGDNDSDGSVSTDSTCVKEECTTDEDGSESCTCVDYDYSYDASAWVKSTGEWSVNPTITFKIDKIKIYSYSYKVKMDIDNCWDGSKFGPYETDWIDVEYDNDPPVVIDFSNNPIVITLTYTWDTSHYLDGWSGSGYIYDTSSEASAAGNTWKTNWINDHQDDVWNDVKDDFEDSIDEWDDWKDDALDLQGDWVVSSSASETATGGDDI